MTEATAGGPGQHNVRYLRGRALYGSRPPAPEELVVETVWQCPTPGYQLELEVASPPIMPLTMALALRVVPPEGIVPQVVVEETVTYRETTDVDYKEVIIHEGETLEVEALG